VISVYESLLQRLIGYERMIGKNILIFEITGRMNNKHIDTSVHKQVFSNAHWCKARCCFHYTRSNPCFDLTVSDDDRVGDK
jgi:hypothetical protein